MVLADFGKFGILRYGDLRTVILYVKIGKFASVFVFFDLTVKFTKKMAECKFMGNLMRFHFHFDRTVQAAAYLLKKSGGQKMEYIRLLKLLYIADREYLAEHGDMITRDRVCAMKFGPVLSCTLNLIRGRDSNSPRWYDFFKLHEKEIFLRNDPGEGELCKAITNRIDAVCERFEPMSWNDIIEITHGFPEWEKFYQENTSTTIPWEEILKAQGAENLIPIVDENIRLSRFNEKLFGHN